MLTYKEVTNKLVCCSLRIRTPNPALHWLDRNGSGKSQLERHKYWTKPEDTSGGKAKRGKKSLEVVLPRSRLQQILLEGKKPRTSHPKDELTVRNVKPPRGTSHWGGISEDKTNQRPQVSRIQDNTEREHKISLLKVITEWLPDFPGGPMVKTLHIYCRGRGFDPRSEN